MLGLFKNGGHVFFTGFQFVLKSFSQCQSRKRKISTQPQHLLCIQSLIKGIKTNSWISETRTLVCKYPDSWSVAQARPTESYSVHFIIRKLRHQCLFVCEFSFRWCLYIRKWHWSDLFEKHVICLFLVIVSKIICCTWPKNLLVWLPVISHIQKGRALGSRMIYAVFAKCQLTMFTWLEFNVNSVKYWNSSQLHTSNSIFE